MGNQVRSRRLHRVLVLMQVISDNVQFFIDYPSILSEYLKLYQLPQYTLRILKAPGLIKIPITSGMYKVYVKNPEPEYILTIWGWIDWPSCQFRVILDQRPSQTSQSRLGVESELQPLAYPTATATPDPSCICDLHHSSQHHQILNPLSFFFFFEIINS